MSAMKGLWLHASNRLARPAVSLGRRFPRPALTGARSNGGPSHPPAPPTAPPAGPPSAPPAEATEKLFRERLMDGEEEILTEAEKKEKDDIIKDLKRRLSGPLADEHGNVPTGKDRPIAIEVDGPSHFYANSKRYTAYTKLKHRLLTRMGYKVLHVPYFEWRRLRGAREREKYMRGKLLEEPSEWLDPEDEKYYTRGPDEGEQEFSVKPTGPAIAASPATPPQPPRQHRPHQTHPTSPQAPASPPPSPPASATLRADGHAASPPVPPAPPAPPPSGAPQPPAAPEAPAARTAPPPPPPPRRAPPPEPPVLQNLNAPAPPRQRLGTVPPRPPPPPPSQRGSQTLEFPPLPRK